MQIQIGPCFRSVPPTRRGAIRRSQEKRQAIPTPSRQSPVDPAVSRTAGANRVLESADRLRIGSCQLSRCGKFASVWLIFGQSDAIVHHAGGVLDVGSLVCVSEGLADAVDGSASGCGGNRQNVGRKRHRQDRDRTLGRPRPLYAGQVTVFRARRSDCRTRAPRRASGRSGHDRRHVVCYRGWAGRNRHGATAVRTRSGRFRIPDKRLASRGVHSHSRRRMPVTAKDVTIAKIAGPALVSTASNKCSIIRRIFMPLSSAGSGHEHQNNPETCREFRFNGSLGLTSLGHKYCLMVDDHSGRNTWAAFLLSTWLHC